MNQHGERGQRKDVDRFVERSLRVSRRYRGLVFRLAALMFGAALSAQSRHIELNDLAKIVSVSDPQISPDGKTIVVVVGRQNLEQDRTDREIGRASCRERAEMWG